MKLLIKIIVGTLIIVPVLILVVILVVPRVIDPNDYREHIARAVQDRTGRAFGIDGNLSLSIFPWVGVTASEVWLAQPEGFGAGNMIEAGEVDLRVRLLPLINRQVEVDTIVLQHPLVHIKIQADGRSSLDGLGGGSEPDSGQAAGAAAAVAVQGVVLEQGTFIWEDNVDAQRFEFRGVNLETGQLLTGRAEPVKLSGEFLRSDSPEPLTVELSAMATIDVKDPGIALTDVDLVVGMGQSLSEAGVGSLQYSHGTGQLHLADVAVSAQFGEQLAGFNTSNLGINLQQQTLDMPGFEASLPEQVLSGSISATRLFEEPLFVGELVLEDKETAQRYAVSDLELDFGTVLMGVPDQVSASGMLALPDSPEAVRFDFNGRVSVDSEGLRMDASNANLMLHQGDMSIDAQVGLLSYLPDPSQLNLSGVEALVDSGDLTMEVAAAELGLNLEQQIFALPGFLVSFSPYEIEGAITVEQAFEAPVIRGDIAWTDGDTGQRYSLGNLELAPGQVFSGESDTLKASGTLAGQSWPDPLGFRFSGLVSIDSDTSDVGIGDANIFLQRGESETDLRLETLSYQQLARTIEIDGLTASTDLNQRPIVATAGFMSANLEDQTLEIPELSLDISPATAELSVSATGIIDNPRLSGKLDVDPFNPSDLLGSWGVDYAPMDPAALSEMSLATVFTATSTGVELNGRAGLDGSTLAGSVSVDNFDAPAIVFDLSLNEINIDRYLPANVDDSISASQQAGAALVLPIAIFRDLNANGRFTASSLISGGMRVQNIDVEVVSDMGKVTVLPRAELYGGTINGELVYRDLGHREELVIRENLDNIRLGELLADTGVSDRVTGVGGMDIDLTIADEGSVQSSTGSINFRVQDGELRGVNFQKLVQQATWVYNQARGREPDPDADLLGEGTQFTELTGTFVVNNMVLENDDLIMKTPGFRMNGRGTIDLNSSQLDYLASAAIVRSAEGQGGTERVDLRGIPIPIRCSGEIADPSCGLDMAELTREIARQEISRKRGEIEEKISEKIEQELNLEGLFDLLKK